MIKINISESKLNSIKEKHYKFVKRHIIGKYCSKDNDIKNPQLKGFIQKYLKDDKGLKKLIVGEANDLKGIMEDVKNCYPNVIDSEELNIGKMYDDFSQHNMYKKTIDEINSIIRELSQKKIDSVSDRFYYKRNCKPYKKGDIRFYFDYGEMNPLFTIDYIIKDLIDETNSLESNGCNEHQLIDVLNRSRGRIIEKLQNIFDNYIYYKNRDEDNVLWGPYPLLMELGLTVCPYCNRNYIHTYFSKDGKVRAQLDHFLPKSKYPYLSASFYNLIPSCSVCNSSLKSDEDFSFDTHLNPYFKGYEEEYKFTVMPVKDYNGDFDIKFLYGDSHKFNVDIVSKSDDVKLTDKIKNNVDAFKIKELYNFHKDYIAELIKKSHIYNPSRIEELLKIKDMHGKNLFSNKEEVINIIVSNYTNKKDLGKRTLSKLTRDIAKELKLLGSQ